jgi:uncharacterized damage-inducible protein DinB
MYRRIEDFVADHSAQARYTLKLFRTVPDTAAGVAIPGGRSLGRLAWHLTCSLGEIARNAGIGSVEPHDDQTGDVPPMATIADTYERSVAALDEMLESAWTDAMLDQEIQMYGKTWKRGDTLTMMLTHEAHHRGQMTVLMRQAGLAVPGMVGPAREEWAAWNMPAQK